MSAFCRSSAVNLTKVRVALVGAGALGSTVAGLLMEAGLQCVTVIDPQTLEPRNRLTSPLLRDLAEPLRHNGERLYKSVLLADEAKRRGLLQWTALPCEVADVGWQRIRTHDVLCCCTDSVLSRVESAYIARSLGLPMIEAGVASHGEATCRFALFPPLPEAACYLCGLSEDRRAQVLAYAVSSSLGCAPWHEPAAMTGARSAVEHAAAGVIRLLARLCREDLPGTAEIWRCAGKHAEWTCTLDKASHSQTCPWHEAKTTRLHALPWENSIDESLPPGQRRRTVQLAWPLCTLARCRSCGEQIRPFQRNAAVRRSACPRCRSTGTMDPISTVETLAPGDPMRTQTPRQLGQPSQHLYFLREPILYAGSGSVDRGMEGGAAR